MKAFLMHKDTDFDLQRALPPNAQALTQDLALDTLTEAMSLADKFLLDAAKTALLSSTTDLETIHYRQNVLYDCLVNAQTVRQIYQTAVDAIAGERKNYFGFLNRYPSGILHRAVDVLQAFVGTLRQLRSIADAHAENFESAGFSRFFAMLKEELTDEYFASIEQHLKTLKLREGILISAGLGQGNKASDYVLHKAERRKWNWIKQFVGPRSAYTYTIHPRDEAGSRALGELADQGVNLVANALAQSTDHILSFFQMLQAELAFYVGCLNLRDRFEEIKQPFCFPVPTAQGSGQHSFAGLYDVCLALRMGKAVVGNSVGMDGKELTIVTGANQGGKSTFLRSIGLAQLMMQAGMFVPAESMRCEVRGRLFTHYKREEDTTMESGKLDEELARLSEIVDHITPGSMLLLNESFAATNEREGSEIARQITVALVENGVKVVFVTHLYEFARSMHASDMANAIFLRAERRADGTRTFRVIEGEPLQTSYGKDVYDTVFETARPPEKERRYSRRPRSAARTILP
jgi:DNA mismatch repair ATPase MutS